jgi:hypothetical protein
MGNRVVLCLRFCRVALLVGVVLAAAGDRIGWASPPRAPEATNPAAPDLARPNRVKVAPSPSTPASAPRSVAPAIMPDVTLVGTVVVEGGPSLAVFQGTRGSRLVWEGEEIVPGMRLLQVDWNWVDVERGGTRQEIRLGSREGMPEGSLGSSEGTSEEMRLSSIGGTAAPTEATDTGLQHVHRALALRWKDRQALLEMRRRLIQGDQ